MSGKRYQSRQLDLSGGLQSGVSDYGNRPRHLVVAENVEFRPYRSCRVRKGSQRASMMELKREPHTLIEWVADDGTSKKFLVAKDAVNGRMYQLDGFVQTLPVALSAATWVVWDQLNSAVFATENGGSLHPFFYRSTNAANTWLDCTLPVPGSTLTLTPAGGGALTPGAASFYGYRLRWIYTDGSSEASTPQATAAMGANTSVTVTTIPVNPAARTDYVGWVLERTSSCPTAAAALLGPFYYVTQGTANNWPDLIADADLGYYSNDNWYRGIPNGHLDGFIALPDRLAGWSGSTLYVSQPIGDDSDAGILNFDPRNGYDFGLGDGDTITAVVRQNDRLIVFKQSSTWALEGNDPSNFSVVPLMPGVGASGCRAAASMGAAVWFYGASGLHRINGNDIAPWGYIEVGDVVEAFSSARLAEVVIRCHLGQRVVIAFSKRGVYNETFLVHDLRYRAWEVWTGWRAQDILIPKVADYGDRESFLIADPRDTGADAPSLDYAIWIAFYGARDERYPASAPVPASWIVGNSIPVQMRTPWIDDGAPDVEKVFEWLQIYAVGASVTVTASIETDPPSPPISLSLTLPATGDLWGAKKWGEFTWGNPALEASAQRGVRLGCRGRRYRITYTASVPESFGFRGHALNAILQPRKEYSR